MPALRKTNPNDTSKPKLWTAQVCPYAHRARIAMYHKDVEYEKVEVDLLNKPEGLFKVNPNALVPVIEDQGHIIYESAICVQYIDEMWQSKSGKDLIPKDPAARAKANIWMDFLGRKIVPFYYQIIRGGEQAEEAKTKFLDGIKTFIAAMANPGPFFMGEEFGVVEVSFAPFANRFIVCKEVAQFEIPSTDEFKRYHTWWEAVQKHPTYQATRVDDNYLVERTKALLDGLRNQQKK